jgi:hypothetical protein
MNNKTKRKEKLEPATCYPADLVTYYSLAEKKLLTIHIVSTHIGRFLLTLLFQIRLQEIL